MAAARNVSAAQRTTLRFSWRRRLASLPMLVVFPAPFTPTTKMTRVPAPLGEDAMPLGPRHVGESVAVHFFAHGIEDFARGLYTKVGGEQRRLQFPEKGRINLA